MKEIKDKTIDGVLERLDTIEEEYEKLMADFVEKQPVVYAFLESDTTSVLTDDEREYLEYLTLVIYNSITKTNVNIPMLTEEQLGVSEELNWEMLESAEGTTFYERLEGFFDAYAQEDLLAFVEDSLTEDPEDPEADMDFITEEGREPMFVVLKAIIDAFHVAIK